MKRFAVTPLFLLCLFCSISSDSAPPGIKISDIISPGERSLLVKGGVLAYARMEGKGEAFTGGIKASFPEGAGRIHDLPSGYTVAAVEKAFFKGELSESDVIFNRLTDYPSLKGMRYYSLTERTAIPLILESRITGSTTLRREIGWKTAVTDVSIKDNRLGTIPMKSTVRGGIGAVTSEGICSGTVSRFGMKVFEPGDYRVYKFLIYDKSDGGWFYCSVQLMRVRSDIMKSLDLLKPENICNRLRGETVHLLGLFGRDRRGEIAAFR